MKNKDMIFLIIFLSIFTFFLILESYKIFFNTEIDSSSIKVCLDILI